MIDSCRYAGYHCPETPVRVDNSRISSVTFSRDLLVFLWLHDYNWSVFLRNVLIYENWFNYMYQRSIKVTIFSTVKLPKYWSLFSLCKHNCLNKLIIYINRDKFFYKSKNITNEQVDLIKWNLFWFCVAKINKRPIRHARKSEYRGKLKTRPKRTKRSVAKTFRSVLEAFRFVQTVQRSCGVVVRFRVCTCTHICVKQVIST